MFEAKEYGVLLTAACGVEHFETVDNGVSVCVARLLEWHDKHKNNRTKPCLQCARMEVDDAIKAHREQERRAMQVLTRLLGATRMEDER